MTKINGIVIDCDDVNEELGLRHDIEALMTHDDYLLSCDGDGPAFFERHGRSRDGRKKGKRITSGVLA